MEFNHTIFEKAKEFIIICYHELNLIDLIETRLDEIYKEIKVSGSYHHTFEELEYGAKMAWRNSNRCIGRLFWNSLTVFDQREANSEKEIFNALSSHLKFATNNGKIRPTITIFRQDLDEVNRIHIWNHQLVRYAGYETEFGVLGDPASIQLTKKCEELGWKGKGTPFDILPVIIEIDSNGPKLFEHSLENVLEVELEHPDYTWFKELQLKWYAVPFISDMVLSIGGIKYSAAPFNGWYMGTEIGARNLADVNRYNLLPRVAERLGLNLQSNSSLWKDRALVELNLAVLHSYKLSGVSIVDHHTAAQQFAHFENNEKNAGRKLTGDWSWLIPPISPATTHIFYNNYDNTRVNPNFYHKKTSPF
ncbi:nitric oxide synthase oxygenase [Litchfieldia alkalitelluris]|uniref:nitric oxide synthase oxygenase n=1 Tax=Litchfieldia alkalitelluris TaxID=304268 RepID=UPI0009974664|nr:nitric oxide synthase oxygenase [Litchfieldia alkalitelluris]